MASIDDGGLRAFLPFTDAFTISPSGSIPRSTRPPERGAQDSGFNRKARSDEDTRHHCSLARGPGPWRPARLAALTASHARWKSPGKPVGHGAGHTSTESDLLRSPAYAGLRPIGAFGAQRRPGAAGACVIRVLDAPY